MSMNPKLHMRYVCMWVQQRYSDQEYFVFSLIIRNEYPICLKTNLTRKCNQATSGNLNISSTSHRDKYLTETGSRHSHKSCSKLHDSRTSPNLSYLVRRLRTREFTLRIPTKTSTISSTLRLAARMTKELSLLSQLHTRAK